MYCVNSKHVYSALQVPIHVKYFHFRTWALLYCCFSHCWVNMSYPVTMVGLVQLLGSCIVVIIATRCIGISLVILWCVSVIFVLAVILWSWANAVRLLLLIRRPFTVFFVVKPHILLDFDISTNCSTISCLMPWKVIALVVSTTTLSHTLTRIDHTSTAPFATATLTSLIVAGSWSASVASLWVLASFASTTTSTTSSSIVCLALLGWLFDPTPHILLQSISLGN